MELGGSRQRLQQPRRDATGPASDQKPEAPELPGTRPRARLPNTGCPTRPGPSGDGTPPFWKLKPWPPCQLLPTSVLCAQELPWPLSVLQDGPQSHRLGLEQTQKTESVKLCQKYLVPQTKARTELLSTQCSLLSPDLASEASSAQLTRQALSVISERALKPRKREGAPAHQPRPGWLPGARPLLRTRVSVPAHCTARQGSLQGRSGQRLRFLQSRQTTLIWTRSTPTPEVRTVAIPHIPAWNLPLQSSPRGSGRVTQRGQEAGTLELGSPSQPQTDSDYLLVSMPTSRPSLSPPPHKSTARKLPACRRVGLGASCFSGVNQSHPEGQ
uniref:Uncharacterized protein LOC117309373 n=1 Tax=Tursiops truncatus TaxID=9739 RepID=A0A6J3QKD5_TURTR|nr:uncharacterized protein LOC117309373 [Tursiops truncatus]